jgi:hypothetical protein
VVAFKFELYYFLMPQIRFLKQRKLLKNKHFLPPLKPLPEWCLTGKKHYNTANLCVEMNYTQIKITTLTRDGATLVTMGAHACTIF